MPGPDLSGPAIADLVVDERVTVAAGVPTIWMQVLPELKGRDTSALRAIPCGGSAVPKALSEAYREQLGAADPAGVGHDRDEPGRVGVPARRRPASCSPTTSRPTCAPASAGSRFGVECRVVEPGHARRRCRGTASRAASCSAAAPGSRRRYYNDPRAGESFTDDGWLRTGDVATMDERGRIRLVDRTKDLIKSGGEWISSVELENELMAHPRSRRRRSSACPTRSGPSARWPASCSRTGAELTQAGGARLPRAARSPSGSSPTTSCSSTRCPRRASASSPRRPCASASPTRRHCRRAR